MVRRLGLPEADWLDLSTGVNPHAWEAPTPPPETWHRLPDRHDALCDSASEYYGTDTLLPVPGSQAALAMLPWLRSRSRVGVIAPGYAEHGAAWARAGHDVVPLSAAQLAGGAGTAFDVLVVINPNNPDGTYFDPDTLLEWRNGIASRGGWMIVDEAFVDPTPGYSLAPHCPLPGLVVLRSVGKFFGLPGMRIGFALGPETLLQRLEELLGPWAVNGPARWVARQSLADRAWQARMRGRLAEEAEHLGTMLARHFRQRIVGTPLFRTVLTPHAATIHEALARQAILVRLLDRQDGLRFGLPPDAAAFERLDATLATIADAQPTGA
jgi:cobalamin biosynthetic protein CobC